MKLLPLILSTILLNGCVASSYVSSIGAKSIHGNIKIDVAEANLSYSKRTSSPFGLILRDVSNKSYDTATVQFNYDDIVWDENGSKNGKVTILVKEELLTFSVFKHHEYVELEHDYRNWYGYPSQGLLILSIPLDLVITIVSVPIVVIGALAMEPPLH